LDYAEWLHVHFINLPQKYNKNSSPPYRSVTVLNRWWRDDFQTLDYAEWLHVHFIKHPQNEKKSARPPSRSVTVLNRWWRDDFQTPRRNRPHPDWPNLIDHPGEGQPSRMVWFGGRQKVIAAD
jgi:hypothetical protein